MGFVGVMDIDFVVDMGIGYWDYYGVVFVDKFIMGN